MYKRQAQKLYQPGRAEAALAAPHSSIGPALEPVQGAGGNGGAEGVQNLPLGDGLAPADHATVFRALPHQRGLRPVSYTHLYPMIAQSAEAAGLRCLCLEIDQSTQNNEQSHTKIQSFAEMA